MEYLIRKVKAGDETDLAYIQTESWKAAFKNILSEELLQKSTEITRATAMYKRLLDESIGNRYILEVDGKPHCIAWWDRARRFYEACGFVTYGKVKPCFETEEVCYERNL